MSSAGIAAPDEPRDNNHENPDLDAVRHQLDLIIEKQRSGPIGNLKLWCDMATNVVRDPADVGEAMEIAA